MHLKEQRNTALRAILYNKNFLKRIKTLRSINTTFTIYLKGDFDERTNVEGISIYRR